MDLEDSQEKDLKPERDLAKIYMEQIMRKAFELGFGELLILFKVRNHEIKEAHIVKTKEKLRPF